MKQGYKPGDFVVYELTVRFDPNATIPYDTNRTLTQIDYGVVLDASGDRVIVKMGSGDKTFSLKSDRHLLRKASWLERRIMRREFRSLEGALQP